MGNNDSGTYVTKFLEIGNVEGKATDQVPAIIGQIMGAGNKSCIQYTVSYIQDSVKNVSVHI